ncbi:MAG: helix-turn-helix domain-containing protein [Bacteroidota bacterium]
MHVRTYFPAADLAGVLRAIEVYEFTDDHPGFANLTLLPSFVNGFLFTQYVGQPARMYSKKYHAGRTVTEDTLLSSLSQPVSLTGLSRLRAVRVLFVPGVLPSLYAHPMSEFRGVSVSLGEALDPALCELKDRLFAEWDKGTQVALVENYLCNRLRKQQPYRRALYPALDRYFAERGYGLRVAKIACQLGFGERDLHRKIDHQVGIPPSQFRNLHRFHRAVRDLLRHPERSLRQIGISLDYTDQSHFNREFRRLSGLSPGAFRGCWDRREVIMPHAGLRPQDTGILLAAAAGAG